MTQEPPLPPQDGNYPPPGGPTPPGVPPTPGMHAPAPLSVADERMWGLFAHLSGIIFGFLGPLVIWLVQRERSVFVNDQGKEALNFQITLLIGYLGSWVLTFVVIGALILPLLVLASIVFSILGAVAAQRGERYRYPVTLRLIS
jgi:uncharacterized protein